MRNHKLLSKVSLRPAAARLHCLPIGSGREAISRLKKRLLPACRTGGRRMIPRNDKSYSQAISLLLFILTLSVIFILPVSSISAKPLSPISLVLSIDPVPEDGAMVDLTLTATTRRDFPRMKLWIELPETVFWIEGELEWTGLADQDVPVAMTVRLKMTDGEDQVIGHVGVYSSGGSQGESDFSLVQATSIKLNSQRSTQVLPFSKKLGPKGQAIIEIPAQ